MESSWSRAGLHCLPHNVLAVGLVLWTACYEGQTFLYPAGCVCHIAVFHSNKVDAGATRAGSVQQQAAIRGRQCCRPLGLGTVVPARIMGTRSSSSAIQVRHRHSRCVPDVNYVLHVGVAILCAP